jgi:hypothetical protein
MNAQQQTIAALIEAIEVGGTLSGNPEFLASAETAFPRNAASVSVLVNAYHGSLDAALSLIDLLMPWAEWKLCSLDGAWVYLPTRNAPPAHEGRGLCPDNPARSLLLAGLRAYASHLSDASHSHEGASE